MTAPTLTVQLTTAAAEVGSPEALESSLTAESSNAAEKRIDSLSSSANPTQDISKDRIISGGGKLPCPPPTQLPTPSTSALATLSSPSSAPPAKTRRRRASLLIRARSVRESRSKRRERRRSLVGSGSTAGCSENYPGGEVGDEGVQKRRGSMMTHRRSSSDSALLAGIHEQEGSGGARKERRSSAVDLNLPSRKHICTENHWSIGGDRDDVKEERAKRVKASFAAWMRRLSGGGRSGFSDSEDSSSESDDGELDDWPNPALATAVTMEVMEASFKLPPLDEDGTLAFDHADYPPLDSAPSPTRLSETSASARRPRHQLGLLSETESERESPSGRRSQFLILTPGVGADKNLHNNGMGQRRNSSGGDMIGRRRGGEGNGESNGRISLSDEKEGALSRSAIKAKVATWIRRLSNGYNDSDSDEELGGWVSSNRASGASGHSSRSSARSASVSSMAGRGHGADDESLSSQLSLHPLDLESQRYPGQQRGMHRSRRPSYHSSSSSALSLEGSLSATGPGGHQRTRSMQHSCSRRVSGEGTVEEDSWAASGYIYHPSPLPQQPPRPSAQWQRGLWRIASLGTINASNRSAPRRGSDMSETSTMGGASSAQVPRRGGVTWASSCRSLDLHPVARARPGPSIMKVATLEDSLRSCKAQRRSGKSSRNSCSADGTDAQGRARSFLSRKSHHLGDILASSLLLGSAAVVRSKRTRMKRGSQHAGERQGGGEKRAGSGSPQSRAALPPGSDHGHDKGTGLDLASATETTTRVVSNTTETQDDIHRDDDSEDHRQVDEPEDGENSFSSSVYSSSDDEGGTPLVLKPTTITFTTLETRTFDIAVSDNPGLSSSGPAVSLSGWDFLSSEVRNVDEYEVQQDQSRRRLREIKLSAEEREARLRASGVPHREIRRSVRKIEKARKKRKRTLKRLREDERYEERAERWERWRMVLWQCLGVRRDDDREEEDLWDKAQDMGGSGARRTRHQEGSSGIVP